MAALSEHEILFNTAALSSLRRQQLVSLSKKYGLKANGKNQEMIERLHEFGQSLTPASRTAFDYRVNTRRSATPSIKMPEPEMSDTEDDGQPAPATAKPGNASQPTRTAKHDSEAWQVVTSGDSSLIEGEDGGKRSESKSGSLRSLGSSLRRAASRSLSFSRKRAASPSPGTRVVSDSTVNSNKTKPPTVLSPVRGVSVPASPAKEAAKQADEPMAVDDDADNAVNKDASNDAPATPDSAIGVAKRHSTMSLLRRVSTIRLVSPSPSAFHEITRVASPVPAPDDDELPLTGLNSVDAIKKRRSVQYIGDERPTRSASHILNRRSMPVLLSPPAVAQVGNRIPSAPAARLYPDLSMIEDTPHKTLVPGSFPAATDLSMIEDTPHKTPVPGSFPAATSPGSPSFVFGSGQAMSSAAFSDAGMKLLQEMQAKMGGTAFNPELLKGKRAEITKLVNTNDEVGSGIRGGWGLSAAASTSDDRFAKAHEREFSKMQGLRSANASGSSLRSITATPGTKRKLETSTNADGASLPALVNGLPAPRRAPSVATEDMDGDDGREEGRSKKRTKVSAAPGMMTSLRGAVSKLSASVGPTPSTSTPRRARSNMRTEARNRFPFLKKGDGKGPQATGKAPSPKTATRPKLPSPKAASRPGALPKAAIDKKSIGHPQPPKRVSSLTTTEPKKRSVSATTAACSSSRAVGNIAKPRPPVSSSTGPPVTMVPMKDDSGALLRGPQPRPRAAASAPSLVRSTASTASTGSLHAARQTSGDNLAASRVRPSSLLAPTASSLARMQSTVKPPAHSAAPTESNPKRPLPRPPGAPGAIPPQIPTMSPFGAASSRTNALFESNFHYSPGVDTTPGGISTPSKKRPLPKTPTPLDLLSPPSGPGALKASPSGIPRARPVSTPIRTPSRIGLGKSPARPTVSSAQRARDRQSGVASIKAPRGDSGVAKRQLEIRQRHERIKSERELRAMLG